NWHRGAQGMIARSFSAGLFQSAQSPSLLAKVHATEELLPLALTAAVGAPKRPGIRTVHRLLMHRQSVRKDHALHGELWRELLPLASGGITLDQGAGRPVAVI